MTLIVGAGISIPEPTGSPDFKQLRNHFLSEAGVDDLRAKFELDIEELSPEQVFDALDDESEETRQAIRRHLWWACEPREPNQNHFAIAAMLGAGVKVWTPNFDTRIETAASRLGIEIQVVAPGDSLEVLGPALIKPHGTFPFPGDPPIEPAHHDYELLFQASRVWLMAEDWTKKLKSDIRNREVFLFGYRGADPDLTPVLLEAFEGARAVTWCELPSRLKRLRRILATSKAHAKACNPSDALLELGEALAPHTIPETEVRLPELSGEPEVTLSNVSKAQLLGQLRGPREARRYLRKALFFDRAASKRQLLVKLLRSTGYDIPWARGPLMAVLSGLMRFPQFNRRASVAGLYAILLDSRPIRSSDHRAIARLRRNPNAEDPQILTRIASIEKLHGDLDQATNDAEQSLAALQRDGKPALEAMTTYILAWTLRQRGQFDRRAALIDSYEDRLPHIGFNWAAWLNLDQALALLHAGKADDARREMDGPFMEYVRRLIRHPMFRLDNDLTEALVRWHEAGPEGINRPLEEILQRHPVRRLTHPPFTAIDTLIMLGDHARAIGDKAEMIRYLNKARRHTRSDLQLAEIELVQVAASGERVRLERLRDQAVSRQFGLIAQTVEAIVAFLDDLPQAEDVVYRPNLPLAGCY